MDYKVPRRSNLVSDELNQEAPVSWEAPVEAEAPAVFLIDCSCGTHSTPYPYQPSVCPGCPRTPEIPLYRRPSRNHRSRTPRSW